MVVVDEKAMLPPPPAYSLSSSASSNGSPVPQSLHPPPFLAAFRKLATLADLPAHLLLHIVHRTFPQAPDKDYNKIERQRKTLRWLTMSLRLVNRTFYIGMSEAEPSLPLFHSLEPSISSCGCAPAFTLLPPLPFTKPETETLISLIYCFPSLP